MPTDAQRRRASEIIVPPDGWPWAWDETGESIIWQDGALIVFREELAMIMERLAPEGCPQFGPLVLLLAGCRGKALGESQLLFLYNAKEGGRSSPIAAAKKLEWLASLPGEITRGVVAKAALATLVFVNSPRMAEDDTRAVVELLRENLPPSKWPVNPAGAGGRDLLAEMRILNAGIAPVSTEAIEHVLRTGLPEAPSAAELDLPLAESMQNLLREIDTEAEFPGLATLVRDVMAAIKLPRALPRPDMDSPGGFSDIGNRGPLHRLLISELAHDDDTLAARIAMNEALYIRREPDAERPPSTLVVLVDAGLRMWGAPRVFGAAVAMACLAKAPAHGATLAFRARGCDAEPISLNTRDGLSSHLAALDKALSAAAAIAPLISRLRKAGASLDVVVITHPLSLTDSEFNSACSENHDAGIFAATVDRDGAFSFNVRTAGGWRPISEARLDIDAIFATPAARSVVRGKPDKPAIFRIERFPFLLPIVAEIKLSILIESGVALGVTKRRDVWTWKSASPLGATRIPGPALPGELIEITGDAAREVAAVMSYQPHSSKVSIARITHNAAVHARDAETTMEVREVNATMDRPVHSWIRGELFIGTRSRLFVISLHDFTVLSQIPLPPGATWHHGRLLSAPDSDKKRTFYSAYFDGQAVRLSPLSQPWLRNNEKRVAQIFQREGSEELWAIDETGNVTSVDSGKTTSMSLHDTAIMVSSSRDGRKHLVSTLSGKWKILDLAKGSYSMHPIHLTALDIEEPPPSTWSVRTQFTRVRIEAGGGIWLQAAKGYWLVLSYSAASSNFALRKGESLPSDSAASVAFEEAGDLPSRGCSLKCAEFPNGRVWLDSRGLLHLQAYDDSLAEISIVLAESTSLPVWSSHGGIIGPSYFVPAPNGNPAELAEQIRAFALAAR